MKADWTVLEDVLGRPVLRGQSAPMMVNAQADAHLARSSGQLRAQMPGSAPATINLLRP